MRWYAKCCNTPIANTLAQANIPFASVISAMWDPELDESGRPRLAGDEAAATGAAPAASADQLALFGGPSALEREVLDTLRAAEPERTTPMEALALLARLRERLEEEGS